MGCSTLIALSFCFFVFFLTSVAVFLTRGRKKSPNDNYLCKAPVVVTSTTHTAPGGYPVSQIPPGAVPNVYAPYPVGQHNMNATNIPTHMPPQPPLTGYQQHVTPYPPYPPMGGANAAASMNPPSYDVAVSGVGAGSSNALPYEKQAPYNPNFSSQ